MRSIASHVESPVLWSGQQMAFRSFLDQLSDQLTRQCPWVKTLVNQGYFIEKTKLIVLNRTHAVQIELRREGGVGAVPQYSWEDPHLGLTSVDCGRDAHHRRGAPAATSSPAASATSETTGTLSSAAPSAPLSSAALSAPPSTSLPLKLTSRHSLKGCH